jgi:hypothetical protein
MVYLHAAIAALLAALLGSNILVSLNRHNKRTRVESQLHEFIRQYSFRDATYDTQHFKETKQLLMLDWLDANPKYTSLDFCSYFDTLIDRYCESVAINQYLERRQMTAANEAILPKRTSA